MSSNWFPGNNPESIPRYGYIPKIALPTVFGDALSYLEMIGRYNAEFNKAIDGINHLAQNIEEEVQNSVENAKIPVYAELVNNGSNIISPNNWNIDNPEALYAAMSAGKLCILHGNLSFNIDGLPVAQTANNMYFILTQFYQNVVDNNTTNVYAVFVNYDETHVRVVKMNLYKDGTIYTSEITDMREIHLPTDVEFEQIDNLFKKCVFVYKGRERIPDEEGQFIELRDNATEVDLSHFFVVQTGASMYVPECAPAVCVDFENGNIGELRYGGNSTPWARVYSCGFKLCDEYATLIASLTEVDGELRDAIESNTGAIGDVNERVDGVVDDLTALGDNVDSKDSENVKYTVQNRSSADKARARANIGAAPTEDPVFIGELALGNGFGASVLFNVTTQNGIVALDFSQSPVRITGVRDPVNAQEVATKGYVDYAVGDVDAVKYSVQDKTDNERRVARENIGALSAASPYAYNTLSVENNDIVLVLVPGRVSGNKALTLAGTSGDTIIAGVGAPVENNHAANKAYVDNKYVESQNTVKYVPQNLSPSQKSTSRANIGAAAEFEAEFDGKVTIWNRSDAEQNGEFAEFVYDTLNESDEHVQKSIHVYADEANMESIYVYGENGARPALYLGRGANQREVAIKQDVNDAVAPITIVVNSSENAWSIPNPPSPSYSQLANVIDAYQNGRTVLIQYESGGIANVAVSPPMTASLNFGILVQAYPNKTFKQYLINFDGTVTVILP